MTPARIGFIGAGGIAQRHLDVLQHFDDVALVAAADTDAGRAAHVADRYGMAAYDSAERMLDAERLDAVWVCVPPFAHGEVEAALVERGLPFFVEKPLAADAETAERVARDVEAKGLVTAVGYHWRSLDVVEHARELLAERPARMALGYWLDSTPPPAWWRRQSGSGGQVVEQTTHLVDLARMLVGEVTRVYAAGGRIEREAFPDLDIDDAQVATLHFETGAVGSLASTCLLNWSHRVGLHLFGDGIALEITDREIMVDVGRGRPVTPSAQDPVVTEDRAFVDAVRGGENRIRVPYGEALQTHRVTMAIVQSAREGRPVDLPLEATAPPR